MPSLNIPLSRLHNQQLSKTNFQTAKQVVEYLGAVQSQDYAAAKWALGLRAKRLSDTAIEQAFTDRMILRTHVLRPTWHFVLPADIRWLLKLTAPRVKMSLASYDRQAELDAALIKRSNHTLVKALRDGKQLTRTELASALQRTGISTDELRLTHLIMHAELDGIICSGPRRGKQFTYALLDEHAPQARILSREASLAELTRRYFLSRGPATLRDFVWWSGLTMADAKQGIEMVKSQLVSETIDEQTYWFSESTPRTRSKSTIAFLLPNYDEYIVGYTDRSSIFDSSHVKKLDARGNALFQHTIMINGQIVGTWKRTLKKDSVEVKLNPFKPLTKVEQQAVIDAANRYGEFLELPVILR